jgi:multiple sugar transport system permease protein
MEEGVKMDVASGASRSTEEAVGAPLSLVAQAPRRRPWLVRARPYLLVAPSLVLTAGILYPFVLSFLYSLQNYNLSFPQFRHYIGFTNYVNLWNGPDFSHTVFITLLYTFCAVAIELGLGLVVALLLNYDSLLTKILRPLLILPLMVAPAIGGIIWKLMTNSEFGVMNWLLSLVGIHDFTWGSSPDTALFAVLFVDVWIFTPFIALLILAGLRALPQEPYEAARMDKASPWFTFRTLTLPMLLPYIVIAVLFRTLDSLQQFDIIYAMTQGGPGDALMNFQLQAYLQSFTYLHIGISAAYMIILWAITYVLSQGMVVYWNHSRARLRGRS